VVSSTVRSPRFRHKNPTSVPPPTTPASTHCLSHATPQAQGPSLLELSGFAFRLQARRSPWPNRVRHPADCWLTSRCSPPCLAATQLRSISRAGERLPGGDSNPFVSVPSRAHKRPSSCSAGNGTNRPPSHEPRDLAGRHALALRPTGRSAASRTHPRALHAPLRNGRAPARPETVRTDHRRTSHATSPVATRSRSGRPGGRPLRGPTPARSTLLFETAELLLGRKRYEPTTVARATRPRRSPRARAPADREVGRFEDPPPRAPRSSSKRPSSCSAVAETEP
jgi:hypothetical protein